VLDRLRALLRYRAALRRMARLGQDSFGPPCIECGLPRTEWMPDDFRKAIVAITGKRPEDLRYVCRCPRKGPPYEGTVSFPS
jgi:hypothetical protein